MTILCEIMGRFGSDKGNASGNAQHNYTLKYDELFGTRRFETLRVFELGLGTNNVALPSNMGANGRPGASLYGWREYFPSARIFGADIDRDILFESNRIQTFYCDQLSPELISALWARPELEEGFDIIVEDGLHTFEANVCFLENSLQKVKPGGFYIIEDVAKPELNLFNAQLDLWRSKYADYTFELVVLPHSNVYDNTIVVVQRKT
jgi:SAM-dependent methyltransferase